MTDAPRPTSSASIPQAPDQIHRSEIGIVAVAVSLSLVAAVACRLAGGDSLGAFVGPLLFAAILTPPLALMESRRRGQALVCVGMIAAIAGVWTAGGLTLFQWARCVAVLTSWVVACWGAAVLFLWMVRSEVFASAITIVLCLLWLSWPVWMSRPLLAMEQPERAVAWLVPVNPPLVVSSIVDRGVWGEQRIAYQLTNLGQDIAYRPPTRAWLVIVSHTAFAFGCLSITARFPRRGRAGSLADSSRSSAARR